MLLAGDKDIDELIANEYKLGKLSPFFNLLELVTVLSYHYKIESGMV